MTAVRSLARDLIRCDAAALRGTIRDVDVTTWTDLLATVSPAIHPYIAFSLTEANAIGLVPNQIRHALDSARRAAILNDLRRRSVLRSALTNLTARGIETMLVKGAALSLSVYPEPYLRRMTDIDIWVADSALAAAARCLLENGYEIPESGLSEGRVSPTMTQRRLRSRTDGFLVELHGPVRSLGCLSDERVQRCWQRAVRVHAQGVLTRALCPEDALVHTALHLARINRFANSQVGLLDIRLLVATCGDTIDWVALARDARDQKIAVYLTIALTMARDVWGARVPEVFFETVGPVQNSDEMYALALEQVWEHNSALPSAIERVLRESGGAARLATLFQRAIVHAWRPSAGEARGPWQVIRQAVDRLTSDVRVKVPAYVRAWGRGGPLARGELRRRARLAQGRGRIDALVRRAEAQLDEPSARGAK